MGKSWTGKAQREVKGSVKRPPIDLRILRPCWEKMIHWAELNAPDECGLLCQVTGSAQAKGEGLELCVEDVAVTQQAVNGTTVEFDEEEQMNWLKEQELWPGMKHGEFPIWGIFHTHPSMGVFWSTTDEGTLVKNQMGNGLLVNIVYDPDTGAVLARVDHKLRFGPGVNDWIWAEWNDVNVLVDRPLYDGLDDWLEKSADKVEATTAFTGWTDISEDEYGYMHPDGDYNRQWDYGKQTWAPSTPSQAKDGNKSVRTVLKKGKELPFEEAWQLSVVEGKVINKPHMLTLHGKDGRVEISDDRGFWVEAGWYDRQLENWWDLHLNKTPMDKMMKKTKEWWCCLADTSPILIDKSQGRN